MIPGLGRCPREGKGHPLQYSSLENPMDYTLYGDLKESDTTEQLSLKCFEIDLVGGVGVHAGEVGCWGQPMLRVLALPLDTLTYFK